MGNRDFSPLQIVQSGFEAHRSTPSVGNMEVSSGEKQPGRKVDISPHLVLRIGMYGAVTLFSLMFLDHVAYRDVPLL